MSASACFFWGVRINPKPTNVIYYLAEKLGLPKEDMTGVLNTLIQKYKVALILHGEPGVSDNGTGFALALVESGVEVWSLLEKDKGVTPCTLPVLPENRSEILQEALEALDLEVEGNAGWFLTVCDYGQKP